MEKMRRFGLILLITLLMSVAIIGCGDDDTSRKVVLTAGFAKDEVFRIEDVSCTLPEMMVYLTNIQNQYEKVYTPRIWDTNIDGVLLEDNVKDMALSKMAQVKAINLLAREHGITLDEEEMVMIESAADAYYGSLSQTEIETMGIDRDVILKLYTEYALSEKLYRYIIKDITPEISDDEARTITVQHILIKTYNTDEDGNRVPFTEYAKQQAFDRANEARNRALNGEDFEKLADEYSDDINVTYSFGKGEMDVVFENESFNLGTDEISEVIKTEYGYHVIKCINTFNREVTDANKVRIIEERREEAFSDEYDEFVKGLTKNLNTELWDSITFDSNDQVNTDNFFETFDEFWIVD